MVLIIPQQHRNISDLLWSSAPARLLKSNNQLLYFSQFWTETSGPDFKAKVSFSGLACALLSVCLLYPANKIIDQSLLLRQLCSLNLELYVEKSPAEQWKSVHSSTMLSRLAWGLFLVSILFMSICGKDKINYPFCVSFAIYWPICM